MLTPKNNVNTLRTEVLDLLATSFVQQNFADIEDIPQKMYTDNCGAYRESIEKDRLIAKYQIMAALGFAPQDEISSNTTLTQYATLALARTQKGESKLSVIPFACNACPKAHHQITNMCQGCVARPCQVNCPKKAISFVEGKAFINQELCINCGLCASVCPYQAILKTKLPCEEACPVGAITKDENGVEHIDTSACISCGKCLNSCPFGAIIETSEMIDVLNLMKNKNKKVIAMLAPAFVGQFKQGILKVVSALKQMGFYDVVEVAYGADITTKNEAKEFIERIESGAPFMTTSCCPAYYKAANIHIPELASFVSTTRTPMYYMAEVVKQELPDCIAVFVGPCLAKRVEADCDPYVDYVLTFEEINAMFTAHDIDMAACDETPFAKVSSAQGRQFPLSGGVAGAVESMVGDKVPFKAEKINGLNKDTIKLLKQYAKSGKCDNNMIEVMCCEGGCINGPGCVELAKKAAKLVESYAQAGPDLREK